MQSGRSPTTKPTSQDENKSISPKIGHKRNSSILGKLSIRRTNSDAEKTEDAETAITAVQGEIKTRKRKGSLRKAVLGKGTLGRKGSDSKKSPLSSPVKIEQKPLGKLQVSDTDLTPRPNPDTRESSPVSPTRWTFPNPARLSLSSLRSSIPSVEAISSAASFTSPVSASATTTDDEEPISYLPRLPFHRKAPSSSGDSYFPPQEPFRRRIINAKSPLATSPQSASPVSEDGWDYSETAFWGYVILITTWLVFVIGMGSCLDVWSWAWDVGETPETTKELEDDPTLPIVGYYPALIVLTCVMAWVWVVVAWVGMKYFRHADLKGD